MALIELDSYTPKPLPNFQAMLDEDGSNMQALYDWVLQVNGSNSATYDPVMSVLTIHTTKGGVPHTFNYSPGYYLVLSPAGEFTQITQNTFELLFQREV